jgi:hypothetical protein
MRRFFAGVWDVLVKAVIVVEMVVLGIPFFLLQSAVGRFRDWIERRWPESDRARTVSWWIGCLAPVLFMAGLIVAMLLLLLWVLEQRRLRGIE